MNRTRHRTCLTICALLLLAPLVVADASAASSKYKDVCASGCTYSSLQDAIDAISDSSASNVYTVFLDSGILETDTSITLDGKDYINIVGRGEGVSILRASSTWFANVDGAETGSDLLDLSNSTNVTLRGLTIDARTNDPGDLSGNAPFNGVRLESCDRILFDSVEVKAVNYGIWEAAGSAGNLIEVYNSKALSSRIGMQVKDSTWHIFSSEIKAVHTGNESASNDLTVGLEMVSVLNTTIWGSHLHAESSAAGGTNNVAALRCYSTTQGAHGHHRDATAPEDRHDRHRKLVAEHVRFLLQRGRHGPKLFRFLRKRYPLREPRLHQSRPDRRHWLQLRELQQLHQLRRGRNL
jgi:hypothetical protein